MYSKKAYKIKYIILFALGLFLTLAIPLAAVADSQPSLPLEKTGQILPSFKVPKALSFCGEPLPLHERHDPLTATRSALRYLSFLKEKFSRWSLALAAYNCGEQRVNSAMDEQKSNDYYQLSLPQESERYLYRLAAIKIIIGQKLHLGH
ncbi:MAG: transglycosylase SLT domain-containing protein [Deltaproteobacteria bacterium]|nr:transglycosylase SLT domain-containing protein [Candidatus Tharpella sp.]